MASCRMTEREELATHDHDRKWNKMTTIALLETGGLIELAEESTMIGCLNQGACNTGPC